MRGRRKKGLETALTGLEMEAALKENDIYLEKALGELGV